MKCPECGYEIPEGHLLCEKCGYEINIVPDFDIEVENSISETLSSIVSEIEPEKKTPSDKNEKKEDVTEKENEPSDEDLVDDFFKDEHPIRPKSKKGIILAGILAAVFLVCIFSAAIFIYHDNSVDYQIKKAQSALDNQNFDKAFSYIERAKEIEPQNVNIKYEEANAKYLSGDTDGAIDIAIDTLNNKALEDDTKVLFYEVLVNAYKDKGDYEKIAALINESDSELVFEEFKAYAAPSPEISVPTGNYDANTIVLLSDQSDGNIYYTLDGISPSKEHGTLYTGEILLEKGEFDLRAVFVNQYGVSSEISNAYYLIDVLIPEVPVITPESGDYTSEFTIKATAVNMDEKIYYTTDGSVPDEENGILYEGPIYPPVGKSNFSFVSVSEDGIASEVVSRSFDFTLNANIKPAEAPAFLIKDLIEAGKLSDADGRNLEGSGKYSYVYNSTVVIEGHGYYYSLVEYFTDNNGSKSVTTEYMYAIDPYTGAGSYLFTDELGNMFLVPFQ